MAIVFPKSDNPYWPLPADYPTLSEGGKRLARVNAASLRGKPDLEVAAWDFFRRYYLFPTNVGFFYKHGVVESSHFHYQWIWDWAQHTRTITSAPRSAAKSTILREVLLRDMLTRKYFETVGFFAKQDFVTFCSEILMSQVEHNERILQDFGRLKPKRGEGIWNHSQIKLRNGSMFTGMSIRGAVLGMRPHKIFFDDVEKDDDLVVSPSDLIESFKSFLFNTIVPMAERGVAIRVIGTHLNHRTFIHWLNTTEDPRIANNWHRTRMKAVYTNRDGSTRYLWAAKLSKSWLDDRLAEMGPAAFAAQYLNEPGTDAEHLLPFHSELNSCMVEKPDDAWHTNPLESGAELISYKLVGWEDPVKKVGAKLKRLARAVGPTVGPMRRFITVDYASTANESSDFSVVHVLGLENSDDYRDTLWSLDCWAGKVSKEELVRRIFMACRKWQVPLVAIEAYPVQMETFERLSCDLAALFGGEPVTVVPRILPIKFPAKMSKAEKIAGLGWRFRDFRVKIPIDRGDNPAYRMLIHQIENATTDLALLRHDDVIDTLAMHQAIGKPRPSVKEDILKPPDAIEMLRKGEYTYEDSGIPVLSGINASDIPADVLSEMCMRRYEEHGDENHVDWNSQVLWV